MDREQGEFLLAMYLDNLPAIAAGRELSAFPKKLGSAKLFVDSDTLVGTLDYGALRVATAIPAPTFRAPRGRYGK
jgi:acetoacetate decarboxylase